MIIHPRGNVTLPRQPRPKLSLLPWCKEVNRALQQLRDRVFEVNRGGGGGGGSSASGVCAFGEIIDIPDTDPAEKGIRGGVIHCGDKNFNVPPYEINLAADSDELIYLELDCEVNRDDDNSILLPGIKTSSESSPGTFWQSDTYSSGPPPTQYPDNDNPGVSTGIGTIIIPVGRLIVDDGVATLQSARCGNVTVEHCSGSLSH